MPEEASSWEVSDESAMRALGASVSRRLEPGSVLGLVGRLGAGKTQFVKGLAAGLGFSGEVTSPTFALVNEYRGGSQPLYHFDLYRLDSAAELEAIGWEEYLDQAAILAVEWADRFPEALPENTLWWHFSAMDSEDAVEHSLSDSHVAAVPRRVWIGEAPEETAAR